MGPLSHIHGSLRVHGPQVKRSCPKGGYLPVNSMCLLRHCTVKESFEIYHWRINIWQLRSAKRLCAIVW